MVGSDNMEDLINVMAKRRIAIKRLEVNTFFLLKYSFLFDMLIIYVEIF